MKMHTQMRKKLVMIFLMFCVIPTLVSLAGSLPIEKEPAKMMTYSDGIEISGTMGENGWYVSPVQVTFVFGPPAPWFYNINGGAWNVYTVPLIIGSEGIFLIEGTSDFEHFYYALVKIDYTLPEIHLMKNMTGWNEMTFIANVYDAISNVWKVEFYLDDEPVFTDDDFPFQTHVVSSGKHNVVAIIYDVAGNAQTDALSTPYVLSGFKQNLYRYPFMKIFLCEFFSMKYVIANCET